MPVLTYQELWHRTAMLAFVRVFKAYGPATLPFKLAEAAVQNIEELPDVVRDAFPREEWPEQVCRALDTYWLLTGLVATNPEKAGELWQEARARRVVN